MKRLAQPVGDFSEHAFELLLRSAGSNDVEEERAFPKALFELRGLQAQRVFEDELLARVPELLTLFDHTNFE